MREEDNHSGRQNYIICCHEHTLQENMPMSGASGHRKGGWHQHHLCPSLDQFGVLFWKPYIVARTQTQHTNWRLANLYGCPCSRCVALFQFDASRDGNIKEMDFSILCHQVAFFVQNYVCIIDSITSRFMNPSSRNPHIGSSCDGSKSVHERDSVVAYLLVLLVNTINS